MRVAIFADIHGNLQALEAVLADLKTQQPDAVVVNGDLVNRGPSNTAVMQHILQQGFIITMGNHDDFLRMLADKDPKLSQEYYLDPFWQANRWCAQQLQDAKLIDALRDLPMTHKIEVDNAPSLLISHGSPRHYREGYSSHMSDETISEILQEYPADILIGSHTHDPLERHWGPHLILNTGAVGSPFNRDPRAQYLLMTLKDKQWQHEFRKLEYDHQTALKAFETSGYLQACGLSAYIFKLELEQARSFLTPFWMWTEEHGQKQTWESWETFKLARPERFN